MKLIDLRDVNVRLASLEEGQALISVRDAYTDSLSQSDLDSLVHKQGATLDEFLALCRASVREFTSKEENDLNFIIAEVNSELKRHGMCIPCIEELNIVKTTMDVKNYFQDYSRGNTIFVPEFLAAEGGGLLECYFVQVLFRVLMRSCPELKALMYSLLDFTPEDEDDIILCEESLAVSFRFAVLGTIDDIPDPDTVAAIRDLLTP